MSFIFARILVLVALTSAASSTAQNLSSCPDVNLRPRKMLRHLHLNFLFVEKPSASLQSSLGVLRRPRHLPGKMPGTTKCPWTWGYDDNPDRVPRYLTKAMCPNCGNNCRKVSYYHRGLVQRCDNTTGETVWKWTVVELPVAFVLDP